METASCEKCSYCDQNITSQRQYLKMEHEDSSGIDLCHVVARICIPCIEGTILQIHYYDHEEVECKMIIGHESGEHYPEGGSGECMLVDLCPDCFRDKLVPWLKSQGADVEYIGYDC